MDATKFKSELFIAFEQVTALFQRAVAAVRAGENHFWKLLRQRHSAIARLGKRIANKPRGLRELVRVRENGLRLMLTSSPDAIVVINREHRFVNANTKALDLFGISKTNMMKFTIDAFLSCVQIPKFNGNGSPFAKRAEKHGECEIRRLDGSLRVAEYTYIENLVPFRHLCRFRNISAISHFRPVTLRTPENHHPNVQPKT
jgi:PAS domain S-box-containing protein